LKLIARKYDYVVIDLPQLMVGAVSGAFLILLSFIPGLFQQFVDGVHNWLSLWSSDTRIPVRAATAVYQPVWLAPVGVALVILSVCAFYSISRIYVVA
jgi:hypothetical protein